MNEVNVCAENFLAITVANPDIFLSQTDDCKRLEPPNSRMFQTDYSAVEY